nr:hypothetical protein [Trinickia fusca]
MRVRGPLVRWDRCPHAVFSHAGRACVDGRRGSLALRWFVSVSTLLSRRSVRRHNVAAARAGIAVQRDDVSSLLP